MDQWQEAGQGIAQTSVCVHPLHSSVVSGGHCGEGPVTRCIRQEIEEGEKPLASAVSTSQVLCLCGIACIPSRASPSLQGQIFSACSHCSL